MQIVKPVVLCVDDEPMNVSLLDAILSPLGFKVLRAYNGQDALVTLQKNRVDCILLDVMMPHMNGYDVCKIIKEDIQYSNIPVIMITSLTSKEDRIKSIEAGADDFITKPFDRVEVLARIKMLLKVKKLNDDLRYAYAKVVNLTTAGENIIKNFNPYEYDLYISLTYLVSQMIRMSSDDYAKPECIVIGITERGVWRWYKFSKILGGKEIEKSKIPVIADLYNSYVPLTLKYNRGDEVNKEYKYILQFLDSNNIDVQNMIAYISNQLYFIALNYDKIVNEYDVSVINNMIMQVLFMRGIASQIVETNNAFNYTVYTLARASEVNDEDTGNHVLRVGEYCAVLAKELGMDDNYIEEIKTQAIVHDVGKIHIPAAILKKPDKLTNEEFTEMKRHPEYGAKILGEHIKFKLGKEIVLCHHEKWDGSGYPKGLKQEEIPLSARIMIIADQYDALRAQRSYKPPFDHQKAINIILNGDGRTLPSHFDPRVLNAFKNISYKFEEIYESLLE